MQTSQLVFKSQKQPILTSTYPLPPSPKHFFSPFPLFFLFLFFIFFHFPFCILFLLLISIFISSFFLFSSFLMVLYLIYSHALLLIITLKLALMISFVRLPFPSRFTKTLLVRGHAWRGRGGFKVLQYD